MSAAPATSPPVPTQALARPIRRNWSIRHSVITAIAAVAVAAAATGVTFLARDSATGAQERVLGYFTALSEGDGPAARGFLQGVEGTDSAIWEPDGLAEGYRAPEDVDLVSTAEGAPPGVTEQDDREYATVTVSYTVDDRPASEMFVLSRKSGGDWNIIAARLGQIEFDQEIVMGANFTQISASPMTVHVGGASALSGMAVPPGVFEVSLKDDLLYEDFTIEVPVAPGAVGMRGGLEPVFPPEMTVNDSAKEELDEQVKAVIDTCAETGNLPGDTYGSGRDCPWKSDEPFTSLFFLDGAWTVDSYPEIDVVMDEEDRLELVTVTPGAATYEDGTTVVDLAPTGPVYRYEGQIVWESQDPSR
ncbi:MAG TPA: hypothetical protein VHG10_10840 [Glycomyces sp.]|nr:hypothetical protein [Glycomyces sp.]